jgi:hypothetical protein
MALKKLGYFTEPLTAIYTFIAASTSADEYRG